MKRRGTKPVRPYEKMPRQYAPKLKTKSMSCTITATRILRLIHHRHQHHITIHTLSPRHNNNSSTGGIIRRIMDTHPHNRHHTLCIAAITRIHHHNIILDTLLTHNRHHIIFTTIRVTADHQRITAVHTLPRLLHRHQFRHVRKQNVRAAIA